MYAISIIMLTDTGTSSFCNPLSFLKHQPSVAKFTAAARELVPTQPDGKPANTNVRKHLLASSFWANLSCVLCITMQAFVKNDPQSSLRDLTSIAAKKKTEP